MRHFKLALILLGLLTLAWRPLPHYPDAHNLIKWNPVCRHQALYWASMVGEQYPVRIAYGFLGDEAHVQPQVLLGDNWYFFKVEDNHVIFIDMENFKVTKYYSFIQFAGMSGVLWMKRISKDEQ